MPLCNLNYSILYTVNVITPGFHIDYMTSWSQYRPWSYKMYITRDVIDCLTARDSMCLDASLIILDVIQGSDV